MVVYAFKSNVNLKKKPFVLGSIWNLAQQHQRVKVDRARFGKDVFMECSKESEEYFDSTSCRAICVIYAYISLLYMWKADGVRAVA